MTRLTGQLEPIRRNGYPQQDRSAAEEAVATAVETNPARFIADYLADERSFGGRYIAADLFKETFPEYRTSKETRTRFNNPLHNSAAVLSAALFRQQLNAPGRPEQDTVVFLTGIPGAGKTSSVLAGGDLPEHFRCVFEGQLSNPETTFEKIQQVLDAGMKPLIIAVHARPENALTNTFKRFAETGRGASVHVMSTIQGNLPACLEEVHTHFGDRVALQVNDCRDRFAHQVLEGWENLKVLRSEGSYEQIKDRLSSALRVYASAELISNECFKQASGLPPGDLSSIASEVEHQSGEEHEQDGDRRELSPASG